MSVIRRVSIPAGQTKQVVPPDAEDHSGQWHWKVLNPTGAAGAVELVDDPAKGVGDGRVLAVGAEWDSRARDEAVYAANGAGSAIEVQVTGTHFGD